MPNWAVCHGHDAPAASTSLADIKMDKLIHDYFGIDYDIVWDIIENKVQEWKNNGGRT